MIVWTDAQKRTYTMEQIETSHMVNIVKMLRTRFEEGKELMQEALNNAYGIEDEIRIEEHYEESLQELERQALLFEAELARREAQER